MLTAIKALWGTVAGKVAIAIGAALLAAVVYQTVQVGLVRGERDRANQRVGQLEVSLDLAVKTNADNAATYRVSTEQLAASRRIADEARERAEARVAARDRLIADIRATPPEDRAPVSPVVRDTVARLWPEE